MTRRAQSPFLSTSHIGPISRLPRRWVSTDAEEKTLGENGKETSSEAPKEEANPLQKEVEAKNKEIIDLKDRYLRSVADFRNLQERTKRDVDNARNFAIQKFATDLIESIDNLDRALGAVPTDALQSEANKELQTLHSGLKMTETILMNTLKKHGLERFDPIEQGRKFDPKVDEAVFMSPHPEKENGDIMHTQSKGFLLNGRVLRAAKVGVVQNPSS
ncbi:putative mitochondrial co-chaperone [Phaeomoniella chlamydospora]|uniref:GrpE protein homolog, mitochondrial n=1 Tax=Phaeomoniella chlamydospora TaxID=158046 RepID=A0A0G2E409_PHACM|nr:putative mitochondrial co-chaperone [Phaeomoniella chlamydospora]